MRERLMELITKSGILCNNCGENSSSYCAEAIANYLLANGVIVPPCKVGEGMTSHDISNIRRFLGAVEGLSISMPEGAGFLISHYVEMVDAILDRVEKGGEPDA